MPKFHAWELPDYPAGIWIIFAVVEWGRTWWTHYEGPQPTEQQMAELFREEGSRWEIVPRCERR